MQIYPNSIWNSMKSKVKLMIEILYSNKLLYWEVKVQNNKILVKMMLKN